MSWCAPLLLLLQFLAGLSHIPEFPIPGAVCPWKLLANVFRFNCATLCRWVFTSVTSASRSLGCPLTPVWLTLLFHLCTWWSLPNEYLECSWSGFSPLITSAGDLLCFTHRRFHWMWMAWAMGPGVSLAHCSLFPRALGLWCSAFSVVGSFCCVVGWRLWGQKKIHAAGLAVPSLDVSLLLIVGWAPGLSNYVLFMDQLMPFNIFTSQ